MAGLPGSIPSQLPAGQDELVRRMRDLERRVDELGPSVARSFKPVLDDLTAKQVALDAANVILTAQGVTLAATVSGLSTAQATLATTVSSLSTAQATLATTVTNLGTAMTNITALVATVIVPEEKSNSAAGFAITTTLATQSTLTFTVPTGYTKMVIVYTAECEGLNSCVDAVSIELYPLLARSDGGGAGSGLWRSYTGPNSPSGANALVSIAITDLITGLTAGGTVTISAQVDTFEADFGSLTTIDTSALVLWMR